MAITEREGGRNHYIKIKIKRHAEMNYLEVLGSAHLAMIPFVISWHAASQVCLIPTFRNMFIIVVPMKKVSM